MVTLGDGSERPIKGSTETLISIANLNSTSYKTKFDTIESDIQIAILGVCFYYKITVLSIDEAESSK